jgi:signal transduction histidine kinase
MLGAALWFTTRRLTRPLTELQQVANAMGRASPPPQIKESGAREIRASLRAFNTMQDRLHRYLDSRTRVLAAMSHDLRTPLTRLRLRAETVDQPEVRTRLVADIEEMDSLVHRSLGLFRGLDDSEPLTAVDVDALLQALAAECAEMGQSLPIKGQAGAPLLARAQSLRRSLRNLIDNAFKYGGKAHIEVRDTPQELVISVCDQGPGIPEDQLQSVCEPFRRLESSRSRETGGVGLGLAIAADVAEQHGGNLQLCNRPEGGLAANLRLPRKH